jgi:hypothetical protein
MDLPVPIVDAGGELLASAEGAVGGTLDGALPPQDLRFAGLPPPKPLLGRVDWQARPLILLLYKRGSWT